MCLLKLCFQLGFFLMCEFFFGDIPSNRLIFYQMILIIKKSKFGPLLLLNFLSWCYDLILICYRRSFLIQGHAMIFYFVLIFLKNKLEKILPYQFFFFFVKAKAVLGMRPPGGRFQVLPSRPPGGPWWPSPANRHWPPPPRARARRRHAGVAEALVGLDALAAIVYAHMKALKHAGSAAGASSGAL
mgnify:CR=1 FL=1